MRARLRQQPKPKKKSSSLGIKTSHLAKRGICITIVSMTMLKQSLTVSKPPFVSLLLQLLDELVFHDRGPQRTGTQREGQRVNPSIRGRSVERTARVLGFKQK